MSYRLKPSESVEAGLKRVVAEQIDSALAEIDDSGLDDHQTVHQVRKRCKKIRGALRLARSALVADGTYRGENRQFRDVARPLSRVRDAQSLIECYDRLLERFGEQVERRELAPVRGALTRRCRAVAVQEDVGRRLRAFRDDMVAARGRVDEWVVADQGYRVLQPGLEKTYRRARRAMGKAYRRGDSDAFHEWRKRVKYHWYHMRLLRDIWRPVVKARESEVDDLGSCLGGYHDVAVLAGVLAADPEMGGDAQRTAVVAALLAAWSQELRLRARALGERLFAEKPGRFGRRLGTYWQCWCNPEGDGPTPRTERSMAAALADRVAARQGD